MSHVVASLSRRAFAVAVLASIAMAGMPALAVPVEPLVTAPWLKDHQSDPSIVVLDVRSAIDGGGAEAYAKAHIPGAVHSDYDKAGWRVTRNGVPFMVPTAAELEKLIGEIGIDEDSYVSWCRRASARPISALRPRGLLDLEGRGPSAVSILDGGFAAWQAAAYPVESGSDGPRRKSSRDARRSACLREVAEVETQQDRWRDARRRPPGELLRRQGEGAGLQSLRPHSRRAQSRQRVVLRSGHQPAAARRNELASDRGVAAGRPGGEPIAIPAIGRRPMVRALRGPRPARRQAVRWLDGRMDCRSAPPGRIRAHALGRSQEDDRRRLVSPASDLPFDEIHDVPLPIRRRGTRAAARLAVPARLAAGAAVLVALVLLDGQPAAAALSGLRLCARRGVS